MILRKIKDSVASISNPIASFWEKEIFVWGFWLKNVLAILNKDLIV